MKISILSRENTLWMQGVSAVLIMLMHFICEIDGYPRFFNIFGSVGVAVFLFISGFGINESYKINKIKDYWHKRICRVIIPCWIVFLFRLPFVKDFQANQLLHNFIFIDSELWFIDFIIRWYIVYWISRKFFKKHTTKILFAFSIACIFLQQLMCENAFSFFAGYMASKYIDTINTWNVRTISKRACVIALYGTIFLFLKEIPSIQEIKGTLLFNLILLNIKLPLAIVIIVLPTVIPKIKRILPFKPFGKISYELYLVHFSFMPYVTEIISVFISSAYSTTISIIFHKLNNLLKKRERFTTAVSMYIYIGISYLLLTKYSMRITDNYGYITIIYALTLVIILLSFNKIILKDKYLKPVFFISLFIFIFSTLIVQYHFDPMENSVDRWSAIANPLTYLFNGYFPYNAKTHLCGYASPFPIWMIFHIPFWAMGNVGLSEIFTAILFIWSIKILNGYVAAIKATILLFLCANIWYEVAVRSDMISNFLLLASFINILISKKIYFDKHPYWFSAIAGLWLSTRLSTAFPLFIFFFPYWMKINCKKKIATIFIVVAVFSITFLPLAIWDSKSLFHSEYNPFILQSRQGHITDTLLIVIITITMAMTWKKNIRKMLFFSSLIIILTVFVTFCHNMYINNNWNDIFNSTYDITYFNTTLPFCITLLSVNLQKHTHI